MAFVFSNENIRENRLVFIYEECADTGVRKIAGKVRDDIGCVFSAKPIGVEYTDFHDTASFFSYPVFFGTVGDSEILDRIAVQNGLDLFSVAKEREVYSFNVYDGLKLDGFSFESAIVIAGSDKRGTIYGLFRLSEMIGISPFTNWLEVKPVSLDELELSEDVSFVSKTPSVKYRGIFINDEWPAFGTWCKKRFGGFNAKMYAHVFELILRLKGNYMWPAMWSAIFSDDGPGDANCVLADELGIVMGTSHHEQCMRQGEEYKYLRGPGSVYGDAWDFRTNRDGITKFWQDGLAKRSTFENVYTVGMRGEADTKILSDDATMEENISLLRDVIKTQNRLISDTLGKDVSNVPRVLALYKEVEKYYYGDASSKGLMDDPELSGVTIMFSDDNFGNLRTVPKKEERDRPGGFGIYYHLDYHGWPFSYEWMNTSYLPKIWEEMTKAYDHGIRDIWVVNVGDIFTNEYPLAFFMDLAYDFEKWGTTNKNSADTYTKMLVRKSFPTMSDEDVEKTSELLMGYTWITSRRRTECCNASYDPAPAVTKQKLLSVIEELLEMADDVYRSCDDADAFYELVYLPLYGNLNIQKMWLLTGLNHRFASMGSTYANTLASAVRDCIKNDRKLTDGINRFRKGKWYGMGIGKHIGFKNWCDEQCQYPVVHTFEPADEARLIVSLEKSDVHTEGGFWSGKELIMNEMLLPPVCGGYIELTTAGKEKVSYDITTDYDFIEIIDPHRSVKCGQIRRVFIMVDREKIVGKEYVEGRVNIKTKDRTISVMIPVLAQKTDENKESISVFFGYKNDLGNRVLISPEDFTGKTDTQAAAFEMIDGLGLCRTALKAYPQDETFTRLSAPKVTYDLDVKVPVKVTARIYASSANPCYSDNRLVFAYSLGSGGDMEVNMVPQDYAIGDDQVFWAKGVIENYRYSDISLDLKEGINSFSISARSPGFVLEGIELFVGRE